MTQLTIIFLGTGGSWPSTKRNVTSIAVKRGREIILFDCGEGTKRQFQKSKLSYMQIKKVFITHFHGDHFLGLPGLIQTMQLNDRRDPLNIYGPPGIKTLLDQILHLGYFKPTYEINAFEIRSHDTVFFDGYHIEALETLHGVPTLAYALRESKRPGKFNKKKALDLGVPEGPLFSKIQKGNTITLDDRKKITPDMVLGPARPGRTIVFSGDTRPFVTMISFAKKADVLIHEATFTSEHEEIAYQYGHTTAQQAAQIAKEAEVKKLILTHISPRYLNHIEILKDAKEEFSNTIVPKDFDEVNIALK